MAASMMDFGTATGPIEHGFDPYVNNGGCESALGPLSVARVVHLSHFHLIAERFWRLREKIIA
jgi:hypothetical protein